MTIIAAGRGKTHPVYPISGSDQANLAAEPGLLGVIQAPTRATVPVAPHLSSRPIRRNQHQPSPGLASADRGMYAVPNPIRLNSLPCHTLSRLPALPAERLVSRAPPPPPSRLHAVGMNRNYYTRHHATHHLLTCHRNASVCVCVFPTKPRPPVCHPNWPGRPGEHLGSVPAWHTRAEGKGIVGSC